MTRLVEIAKRAEAASHRTCGVEVGGDPSAMTIIENAKAWTAARDQLAREDVPWLLSEVEAARKEASDLRAVIAGALRHVREAQSYNPVQIEVERRLDDAEAILMGVRSGSNGELPYDEWCVDPKGGDE